MGDSVEGIGAAAKSCKSSSSEPAAGQVVVAEGVEVPVRQEEVESVGSAGLDVRREEVESVGSAGLAVRRKALGEAESVRSAVLAVRGEA